MGSACGVLLSVGSVHFLPCLLDRRSLLREQSPGDPRILGGDGDTRTVITPPSLKRKCPARERISFSGRTLQYRASSQDEQGSQITVTSLGDVTEPALASGGILAGHQSKPGG